MSRRYEIPARGPCAARLAAALFAMTIGVAFAADPRLELDVDLDPGTRILRATAVVVPQMSPDTRLFRFALHEALQVTAASVEGAELPIAMIDRAGSLRRWQLQLPQSASAVRIEYGGTLRPLDASLGERAVLQGLPPMASAKGSFLPASSAWYPQPASLFSYRVSISVPADQMAVVAGRLQAEQRAASAAGRYRATFEFAHPAEGIDLMAGPWVVRERLVSGVNDAPVRLRTYFFAELDATKGLADGYLDDTARYLRKYAQDIGAYPFSEFSIVASALPTGFGMPTLTYIGADVLRLPFIRATSLGHEVLHNWWGNGVYVDYASGNWSEGLTTFMADYAYKEAESAQAAREMRQGWLRDYASVPPGHHQTLASFRSRTHGAAAAVGYGKAAMVFVMLRDAIGAEAFGKGIRAFWSRNRFRTASWSDLRAVFEAAAGRSLAGFFAQWLERAEGPDVAIVAARAAPDKSRSRLALAIEQTAPAYALHAPVELVYADRSEMRWMDLAEPRATLSIDVDALPDAVRLDPELRVWRALRESELPPILRRWIVARAPRLVQVSPGADVREAAEALAKKLCEAPPQPLALEAIERASEPVLIAGLHDDVDRALARAGLPSRPSAMSGHGSAQVWTLARASGAPIAVISAADAASLRALERPLPHYGGQSWLVFDGSRAAERGIWPAAVPRVPVVRP